MKYLLIIGAIIFTIFVSSPFEATAKPDTKPTSLGVSNYYEDEYQEEYEDEPLTNDNWVCTSDCSGHEAGYAWAEDRGITDPDECSGNSNSFIEGCEAYANEYQAEYDNYYDDQYYNADIDYGY